MALGQPCARAVLLAPAENYDGEDFSGGNFDGQNGSQGSFLATSFNNASLIGTDLSASNLKEASFVSADLSGANSDASIFLNAVLDSANLSGCRSSQLDHRRMATAGAADVTRVNLGGNDLSSFALSGLDLSAAHFINTNLGNEGLTDTNLTGADLSGANLFGASVSGASFTGSTLFSADLRLGGDTTAQGTGFVFTGYVKGAGAFTGTFELGQSPAIVTVENIALTFTSAGVLKLGGLAPGSGHDQIAIGGDATFDGTLRVVLIEGFELVLGDLFQRFTGSKSGAFSTLILPALNEGLAWDTDELASNGTLTVVPEPASFGLCGAGILTLGVWSRRRA